MIFFKIFMQTANLNFLTNAIFLFKSLSLIVRIILKY
jgi:hypothetical protein